LRPEGCSSGRTPAVQSGRPPDIGRHGMSTHGDEPIEFDFRRA
jgi:hypothetical protein